MGLRYVKGLKADQGEKILWARAERPFRNLQDFVYRTGLSVDQLQALSEAGAFESLGVTRREALCPQVVCPRSH